ncbi:hypothetical protein KYD98_03590 [Clostridium sp. YB-6]|uniref:Uncharacterized protein n=2 Tax=Clostridium weizhouense TaxID=2859781 RepID=A0ABS7AKG8_9CLOT|nr:hypothetical protein [Clostridium weizhouense]
MKLILKEKKHIIYLSILTLIIVGSIIFILLINKNKYLQTISPLTSSKNIDFDLTGDSKNDTIKLIKRDNTFDINIDYHNTNIFLSSKIKDNVLFNISNSWPIKIYLYDISRDLRPEIILQGTKNNKSMCYVFNFYEEDFYNLYSSDKNVFGILDSNNTKTPQCYSLLSSKGISSLNSFMLINNKVLDTTKDSKNIPSFNNVISFINLIEAPYELDSLPNIFSSSITNNELSVLWNLDKENYSYYFQDGFFYDYEWDTSGNPISLKWRLTFERSRLKSSETDKNELVLSLDCHLNDSNYNITSIEKLK